MVRLKSWTPILVASLMAGCLSSEEEKQEAQDIINGALDLPGPAAPTPPDVLPNPVAQCFNQRFTQPEAQISRKVDLLFVADTSGSLDIERQAIANGIDAFVAQLPSGADYQVAVSLAHSPKSSFLGKLYRKKTEPAVLRSSELSLDQIRTHLKSKLTASASDYYSDGGELGMFAALELLKPDRLEQIRTQNLFFRKDAALVVIFISDENDICAEYPAGVKPVGDPDGLEAGAKKKYCTGVTPSAVVQRIQEVQGQMPSLLGAIVYNQVDQYPRSGENEYGYGYMDMVVLSQGVSIDIAEGHYAEGLSTIGKLTTTKLTVYRDFVLPLTGVASNTIYAKVDGLDVTHTYSAESNTVHLPEAGGSLSTVDIHFCLEGSAEDIDPNPTCGLPNCNVIGI